jgi:hypothetical protein
MNWRRAVGVCVIASLAVVSHGDTATRDEYRLRECVWHLREIGVALDAYEADNGEPPEWLSSLYPRYIGDVGLLLCPADTHGGERGGGVSAFADAHDPNVASSYLYEFNPSWRERKNVQRGIVGDVIPIVRCWHHLELGRMAVANLDRQRRVYLSTTMWEELAASQSKRDLLRAFVDEPGASEFNIPPSVRRDITAVLTAFEDLNIHDVAATLPRSASDPDSLYADEVPTPLHVAPMTREVSVTPGSRELITVTIRNSTDSAQSIKLTTAEMYTDEAGEMSVREGASDLLTLVDPGASVTRIGARGESAVQFYAALPEDADSERTAFVMVEPPSETRTRSTGPGMRVEVTFRIASRVLIVPRVE